MRSDADIIGERVETLRQEVGPLRNDMASMRERLAKLEERSDKLVKDRDESSRRWLQIAIFAAGAVLSIFAQLAIRSLPAK